MKDIHTELREEFMKDYDGLCLGSTQGTSDANKVDICDWWLERIGTFINQGTAK